MATWTGLTYAFGSLLTSTKMTQNQANFTALAEKASGAPQLAANYVTASMIGAGEVGQSEIGNSAVGQGELKTATSAQSVAVGSLSGASLALTGSSWSMWTASSDAISNTGLQWGNGNTAAGTLGVNNSTGSSITFYVDGRYIQASPPHMIGDTVWGHFFYLLRNKSTGEVLGTTEAEDPTWAHNGLPEFDVDDIQGLIAEQIALLETNKEFKKLPDNLKAREVQRLVREIIKAEKEKDKNSAERMIAAPHPFADYWDKPLPAELEIVLIDLRGFDVKALKKQAGKDNKKADQALLENISIGDEATFSSYNVPEIQGFTDKVKIRKLA